MIFVIESIAACVIFTIVLEIMTINRREAFANDYPPIVTDRLRQIGMIAEKTPAKRSDIIRKLTAAIVFAVVFALIMRYINGISAFLEGALTAYALWLVVDWYDFLVVDILLAPFDKFYKAAEISAFESSAVKFHFKASVRGMAIGIIFAPIVGFIIMIL
ncbi:MAG: hypothetical protein J1E40_07005 [Oscillospiraceae bacterium]|nr:hypothetical protein [Oscillospiraceae bacterium]